MSLILFLLLVLSTQARHIVNVMSGSMNTMYNVTDLHFCHYALQGYADEAKLNGRYSVGKDAFTCPEEDDLNVIHKAYYDATCIVGDVHESQLHPIHKPGVFYDFNRHRDLLVMWANDSIYRGSVGNLVVDGDNIIFCGPISGVAYVKGTNNTVIREV